jgi:outer membrane receptor protein involved in Fe transport
MQTTNKVSRAVRLAMTFGALSAGMFTSAVVNAQEETAKNENSVERIEVTGSRILREGAIAPSPVTVISGEDLVNTGAMNIGEVLNKLPALATTFSLANSGRFIGTAGISLLDLRGMGTDRTLVLVDGKRHVASSPGTSSVDTNTIPSSWIDRVEIITGGASAVYGADAVTGVVNFVLKKDITGLNVSAIKGFADNSQYKNEKYTFSFGQDFAEGRGNAAVSIEYNSQNSLNALDNPWTATSYASFPYALVNGPRPAEFANDEAYPDRITLPNAGYFELSNAGTVGAPDGSYDILGTFDGNGNLVPVRLGTITDFNSGQCAGAACDFLNLRQYTEIQPKFERVNYNFKTNYDVTDELNAYFEAKYSKTEGENIGQPFFRYWSGANRIQRDNAFLDDALAAVMDERGYTSVIINKMYNDIGRRLEENTRETTRFVTGIQGDISENWSMDVSLVHGKSEIERVNGANVILANYANAIDAVFDGSGNIVCRSEAARADGCVPANIMGDGLISQEAIDYVTTTSVGTSEIEQTVFNATFSNSAIYEMPAGMVGFAGGIEYRDESSVTIEDPFAKTGATFFNALGETDGSYDVKEAFFELSVPLLADMFLIDTLVLDTAVRYADYSTIGNATSWKLGLDWTINPELRARFTVSEAIRAPNIDELFSGQSQSFAAVRDRCKVSELDLLSAEGRAVRAANCAALGVPADFESNYDNATLETLVGGNPDLQPEESKSITAGIVYQPEWLDGFSFTADYWEIDIEDTISGIGFQTIIDRCLDSPTGVDNQFCSLITRDPATSEITLIKGFALNIARSLNSGVDFEFGYDFDALGGRFNTSLIGTYLIEAKDYPFAAEPENYTDFEGVLGDETWQGSLSIDYTYNNLTVGWNTRFINGVELYSPTQLATNPNPSNEMRYGSYFITDASIGYNFENGVGVKLGIDNLFNRSLPGTSQGNGAGSAIYDNIGRFGYVQATYKF